VRAYFAFAACAFARSGAYRINTLLRIVTNLANISIQTSIWRTLLSHGAVAGVDLHQMVTYSIISTCITMILLHGSTINTADRRLNSGDIAVDLIKPFQYSLYLAADAFGVTVFQAVYAMTPTLLAAAALFGLRAPDSVVDLLAFVVAIATALAISFALGYIIALLGFWFLATMHFEWSIGAFMILFSGQFLPIWFFPSWLAAIAAWLPFRYMNFVPVAIYLGQIPVSELGRTLCIGVGWGLSLLLIARSLWMHSIKRLVVQGG